GAKASLAELSRDDGAALDRANQLGSRLMEGIREAARKYELPALISGFGTAFAVHFTRKSELVDYRDTLEDDREMLRRFLKIALEEGLHIVPDGRLYTSAAHTERDAQETLDAFDRTFSALAGNSASA